MISKETQLRNQTMYQYQSDPMRWMSQVTRRPAVAAFRPTMADKRVPDLHSQLEALLDAVWAGEANWRFDDRLDQALRAPH